ncbi:MAG: hypothetical protein CMC93_01240 [Flavobacteriaceae bacterium]|nr:hypothetical protein [Flavobacteriaceae bacterium]
MSNFENQIYQLKSESHQAQMNLHFIFNVLNNIQSVLILESEKEINYFMGHLPKFVLLTLNMTKQKFVALSEEIEYLKSYLELQRLQSNSKFDYCFDISFDLNISKIHLPPLLPQPYEIKDHSTTPLELITVPLCIKRFTRTPREVATRQWAIDPFTPIRQDTLTPKLDIIH